MVWYSNEDSSLSAACSQTSSLLFTLVVRFSRRLLGHVSQVVIHSAGSRLAKFCSEACIVERFLMFYNPHHDFNMEIEAAERLEFEHEMPC